MATHKAEAIRALQHISKILVGPDPIDGLARVQLQATVEFALAEVEAIQELKRKRPGKGLGGGQQERLA